MTFFDADEQNAAAEAVALGRGQTLPLIARTPNMAEQAARGRGVLMLAIGGLGLFALLVGGFDRDSGEARPTLMILAGLAAGLVALLWLIGRSRSKDLSAPAGDPGGQIIIEVREEALTVRRAAEVHVILYSELSLAICAWRKQRRSHFAGADIETPFGRLRLDDGRFVQGKAAAAAICRLIDERGILPPVALPCAPPP